jgi:hypothetical protein
VDFVDSLAIRTSISLQDHASFDGDLSAFANSILLSLRVQSFISRFVEPSMELSSVPSWGVTIALRIYGLD